MYTNRHSDHVTYGVLTGRVEKCDTFLRRVESGLQFEVDSGIGKRCLEWVPSNHIFIRNRRLGNALNSALKLGRAASVKKYAAKDSMVTILNANLGDAQENRVF